MSGGGAAGSRPSPRHARAPPARGVRRRLRRPAGGRRRRAAAVAAQAHGRVRRGVRVRVRRLLAGDGARHGAGAARGPLAPGGARARGARHGLRLGLRAGARPAPAGAGLHRVRRLPAGGAERRRAPAAPAARRARAAAGRHRRAADRGSSGDSRETPAAERAVGRGEQRGHHDLRPRRVGAAGGRAARVQRERAGAAARGQGLPAAAAPHQRAASERDERGGARLLRPAGELHGVQARGRGALRLPARRAAPLRRARRRRLAGGLLARDGHRRRAADARLAGGAVGTSGRRRARPLRRRPRGGAGARHRDGAVRRPGARHLPGAGCAGAGSAGPLAERAPQPLRPLPRRAPLHLHARARVAVRRALHLRSVGRAARRTLGQDAAGEGNSFRRAEVIKVSVQRSSFAVDTGQTMNKGGHHWQ